jgi:PKD repeat protein
MASNSPTSYAATTLPAGLSLNATTGAITGTPSVAGNTTVTLSATNSGGTGSGNLTIRITQSNQTSQTPVATLPPAAPPAAQNGGQSTSAKKSKGTSAKKSKGTSAKKSKGTSAKKSKGTSAKNIFK